MKTSKRPQKVKVWSTNKADIEFSKWVRARDTKCVFCGNTEQLTNSHYWGRYVSSTRYDPENCDTLCMGCHFKHENAKQGFYHSWKLNQLGKDKYDAMQDRYYQESIKRKDAIKAVMELIYAYPQD